MSEPPTALESSSPGPSSEDDEPVVRALGGSPNLFAEGAAIAGKYRLIRYIARGGMAEVWLATHLELKNEVALKFVDVRLMGDRDSRQFALERFRFEAQISAKLTPRTRHVVAVHDAGMHERVPYLAMEYIAGRTIEAEVDASGPFSPERFADVLDQVADALTVAHAMGIVHRDIKPSNLLIVNDPAGEMIVKVADFGVAKAVVRDLALDRPRETGAGELVGSPAFMSPEQIRSTGTIDARTDVWSLGVVAYEALTGKPCFEAATISDLIVAILGRKIVPLSQCRPELSRALDAWLDRALAVEPEARFGSVREMAASFRAAIAQAPRRRASVIVAGLVAVTAAAALMIALVVGRSRPAEQRVTTIATVVTTASSAPPLESARPIASIGAVDPVSPTAPATEAARARTADVRVAAPKATSTGAPKATETVAPAAPPQGTAEPPPPAPPPPPPPKKKRIDASEIQ